MNRRAVGSRYEEIACGYLVQKGVRIIRRNFRCREGEVDIVCRDKKTLVFVEVKYRSGRRYGFAEEAVSYPKMRTICRVSDFYRIRFGFREDTPIRYDVIAIESDPEGMEHIRWHKNAFSYIPR